MRVLVIGGTGTVGNHVVKELAPRHEVIVASRSGGDVRVDIEDEASIAAMYEAVPGLDAVAVTTGGRDGHIAPVADMTVERYRVGLDSKLLGQVNVVLQGLKVLNRGGSFTLIGGTWATQDIVAQVSNVYMVNAALEGFVRAAAVEMPNGLRINCVSPSVITESMEAYAAFFRGFSSVPASRVALAFSKSIEGILTGQNFHVTP